MLRLWLIRHGETDSNREGVFQGQIDVELNELGIKQAQIAANRLAAVRFDGIFSSDLLRAGRTAAIIASQQNAPVILDPDLREMHYGILQGVRYDAAAATLAANGLADEWHAGTFTTRGSAPPGGESARMVRNRASRFLQRLEREVAQSDSADVLVVAHGGQLRIMLTVLLGLPLSSRSTFAFANCGVTRVSRYNGRAVLDFHNMVLWSDESPAPTRL